MSKSLLHNGNQIPFVLVTDAINMKEKIKYCMHSWKICSDLKVIVILLRLQLGYTNCCCFPYELNMKASKYLYTKKIGHNTNSWSKDVSFPPLEKPEFFLLPSLHMKLSLIKNIVKAMDKTGVTYLSLKEKFSRTSDAKMKQRICVGMQIGELCI